MQKAKLEDDSFPVNVPADPRSDAVSDSHAIHDPKLHLLIGARKQPGIPEGHYKWGLLCWSKYFKT